MIKFLNFLSTVCHSFIEMFGYEYYIMTSKRAVGIDDSRAEPRSFFELGYRNDGPEEKQIWGFGQYILLSGIST